MLKLEESILRVLVYFDLFNYPVTAAEIRTFIVQPVSEEKLDAALKNLLTGKCIFQLDEFISLQDNFELVERRRNGNRRAGELLEKAKKISRLLYRFPYVRAVGVSGSVSKNFADEEADIDYFIITKANRLWIARTFLHLYKKIPFVKGRNQWYCMNYFVDEAVLEVEEKNIYTATELVTLKPMYGNGTIQNFFEANEWATPYFPNFNFTGMAQSDHVSPGWIKRFSEFIFNNKIGNWLDNYFFRLTTKRWRLKETQRRLNTKGELMGLKTSKHCSKPNPIHFHDVFLEKYNRRVEEERSKWNLKKLAGESIIV